MAEELDNDQLERIRQKAYAIVSADPGGPNADQARRILSKLPKVKVGRNIDKSLSLSGAKMDKVPGEDFGAFELPTADEQAGIENNVASPGLGTRMAATAADPSSRRQFERGLSDMITFGAAHKIAGAADPAAFGREQEQRDTELAPNARTYGRLAGALSPRGATALVGRGALRMVSPITNAGTGLAGKAFTGLVGGAVANELAIPVISGAQEAIGGRGPEGETALGAVGRVGRVMKEQATNPANALIGGGLGMASGLARGIRETGQTGRDIQLVEKYGASATPFGPRGGAYRSPLLEHMEGTARDQGRVSRMAAEKVMGGLDDEQAALSREYGAAKQQAGELGQLEGRVDPMFVREEADRLLRGEGLTAAEKGAIEREVVAALDRHPSGMTVDDFNDFRQKLGRIFGVGPGETAVPALDLLRRAAKRTVDETEMGPINEAYHKGLGRIERQQEQLGITGQTRRDIAEKRIANAIARRGAEENITAGIQEEGDLGIETFLRENPKYSALFDTAKLLAAKERMTPGIEPTGGFFRRLSRHGLLEKNLEPAIVGLYRLGRPLEKGSVPAALAAQLLLGGGQQ